MNLTNKILNERIHNKERIIQFHLCKIQKPGKTIYVFRSSYPLKGGSNREEEKAGLSGLLVILYFLTWVLMTQMFSVRKNSLSCTFLQYYILLQ